MPDNRFEWDRRKSASNLLKHGVGFDKAALVFDDPFVIEWEDRQEDHGETRFIVLGMVESRLLFVVYTTRGERIRIISA